MNVLSVPVEVIDTCLLPYLGWNDLLRLRRTCKKFKNLADDYIRRHSEMAPELEINERDKNFRAFLNMGIPSKRIFLNNLSGSQFYNRAPVSISQFLEDYGPLVTHLRVEKFSVWCTENGKQFLEGFPNLISFQATETALKRHRTGTGENPNRNRTNLPNVFGRLQILKLYQTKPDLRSRVNQVLVELLRRCPSLEHFSFPFATHPTLDTLTEFFGILSSTIRQRNGQPEPGPFSRIQTIEFSNRGQSFTRGDRWQRNPDRAHLAFHELCSTCGVNNVRLVNVRDSWFSMNLLANWQQWQQIRSAIVSLTFDVVPTRFRTLNMPNLEKLKLESYCGFNVPEREPCNLPMLKSLELKFNSGSVYSRATFSYFFEGVVHENLTDLHLKICPYPVSERTSRDHLAAAESLVRSCPRLKRFTLEHTNGTCDAMVSILERFETLEEVNFIRCREIRNVDFVGPDEENPRFQRFTSLRKLSLTGMDYMPNLSDVLFSSVIRHMELLTHLTITASRPIRSVTLQGIESLLERPFSKSIEKFLCGMVFRSSELGRVSSSGKEIPLWEHCVNYNNLE